MQVNKETGEVLYNPSIYKAIFEVQKEVGAIKKKIDNEFTKKKYADFNTLLEQVNPVLHRNGVIVIQQPTMDGLQVLIETLLVHVESGETLNSVTKVPMKSDRDPQAFGSSVTYGKRYALMSILGLATEDDDGRKGRVNYEEVMEKIFFETDVDALKKKVDKIKGYDFPNWHKQTLSAIGERKMAALKKVKDDE